jgi:short-subunit dehydrogenase
MGTNGSTAGMLTSSKFKEGSVVVLTGAGTGLGREVAYLYAKRGCPMIIHSLTQDEVDAV